MGKPALIQDGAEYFYVGGFQVFSYMPDCLPLRLVCFNDQDDPVNTVKHIRRL